MGCSATCGIGYQTRNRNCSNPSPMNGGANCSLLGSTSENRTCSNISCPVNGNFSMWSNWTMCTVTCGGGYQTRNRNCSNPSPMYGGANCSLLGAKTENRTCGNISCPINGGLTMWSNWTMCSVTCGIGYQTRNRNCSNPLPMYGGANCSLLGAKTENRTCSNISCPVNGNFSMWSNWTMCSVTCGGGYQTRNRNCSNPSPMFGGANCSLLGANTEN